MLGMNMLKTPLRVQNSVTIAAAWHDCADDALREQEGCNCELLCAGSTDRCPSELTGTLHGTVSDLTGSMSNKGGSMASMSRILKSQHCCSQGSAPGAQATSVSTIESMRYNDRGHMQQPER